MPFTLKSLFFLNMFGFLILIAGSIFYILLVCVISVTVNVGRFLEFRTLTLYRNVTTQSVDDNLKGPKSSLIFSVNDKTITSTTLNGYITEISDNPNNYEESATIQM